MSRKISLVIPTLNAGDEFDDVLRAVRAQEGEFDLEIVVVDSESSDRTVSIAESYEAKVVGISRHEFNHGGTRNLGIQEASGDVVALLTQDSKPRDPHWLAPLVKAFDDPKVGGAYSRVIPRVDASPLVERSVCADLVYSEDRLYKVVSDLEEWRAKHPFERRVYGHFNNVSSCVRKETMRSVPFPEMFFGEDLAWGIQALESGWALVYEPDSVVVHSHPTELRKDFLRHRADAKLQWTLLGFRNRPTPWGAIKAAGGEVRKDWAFLRQKSVFQRLKYGVVSPVIRTAQILGQVFGSYGKAPSRPG